MTQPERANYVLAQEKLAEGIWTVDPGAGLIFGQQGNAFRRLNSWGYVQIKFRRAENWRKECAVLAHRVIWEWGEQSRARRIPDQPPQRHQD